MSNTRSASEGRYPHGPEVLIQRCITRKWKTPTGEGGKYQSISFGGKKRRGKRKRGKCERKRRKDKR